MQCARCDHEIRADSGVKGVCEVCGLPLCYRCVMLDRAQRCSEHEISDETRGETCAICGVQGLTALNSAVCSGNGCHARICNACLAVGLRRCPEHQTGEQQQILAGATRADEPLDLANLVTCSVCGRRTPPALVGRHCADPSCSNAICMTCAKAGYQSCGIHLTTAARAGAPHRSRSAEATASAGEAAAAERGGQEKPSQRATAPAEAAPVQAQRVCSRCGIPVAQAWIATCGRDGCERLLCRGCADGVFPLCSEHLHEWLLGLREATEAEPPDEDAQPLTAAQARLRTVNFFSRLQHRMSQPQQLAMPDGGMLQFGGWKEPSCVEECNDLAELALNEWKAGCEIKDIDAVPLGRTVRYELATRTWASLGMRRRRAVIEARAVINTPRYLIWGRDWQPADLLEIIGELEDAARDADQCGYFHLLVLFSPTGWSEQSVQAVAGDTPDKRLLFPSLRVALAGPQVGDLIFSAHDGRLGELDELLRLQTDDERIAALAEILRENLKSNLRSGVTIAEAMEILGVDDPTAREVFDHLCANHNFVLLNGGPDGPMLAHR